MSTTSVGQIGLDLVVNQNQFNRQMAGIQSLAKKTGAVIASAFAVDKLVQFGTKCIELSSDLQEVQNVANIAFPNMSAQLDAFAESADEAFGLSETMAKRYSSLFGTMAEQFGFTEKAAYEMGTTLAGLAGDVASFYDITQDEAYTKLKSVFSGETETLKDIGVVMTQSALDAYALANGYEKTTKSMSEAEKVALRYAFVQNQLSAAAGDFARTSDSWANQVRLLKLNFEQLGTVIGGSLINAFKPLLSALNVVIGKFTEFAKVVSDSLGKIFGWKYEDPAGGVSSDLAAGAGSASDISDGIGSAADKAKKLKQQLQGFDELNVLTSSADSNSGSGSGGAGASGEGAGSGGGQWVKTESLFESDLDSLYKLGEYIGNSLTDALNGIDWEKVYQGARNFGSGLAEFLNGLISPGLFGAVGRTIANSLNTVLYAALSFGQTFDFYDFGVSIAAGINEFFRNYDFGALAETINVWVEGIKDVIVGFLKTLSWKDILSGAGNFLGELELDTVALIIGAITIKKIMGLHLASAALSFIGTAISQKIAQAIAGKLGVELAAKAGIGEALKGVFSKAAGFVISWASTSLVPALSSVGSAIASVITGPWGIAIAAAFAGILLIVSNWDSVVSFAEKAGKKIADVFSSLRKKVGKFFKELWADISTLWGKASQWFSESVAKPIMMIFEAFSSRMEQVFEGLWIIIQAIWIIVSDWFESNVASPVIGLFEELSETVSNFFSQLWISIQGTWSVVSNWFDRNVVVPVTNLFNTLRSNVLNFFSSLWSGIQSVWASVCSWFNGTVISPLKNAFKTACDSISGFFANLWTSIRKGVASAMNAVIAGIEKGLNGIINGINKIIDKFNKIVSVAAEIADVDWGGVSKISNVTLGRISTYETGGFPDRASLFWAGEHGIPELLGTVNGQTAVTGGAEITGIREAVYSTAAQELEIMREQNMLLRAILEKESGISGQDIFNATRTYAREYTRRTGKSAFSY